MRTRHKLAIGVGIAVAATVGSQYVHRPAQHTQAGSNLAITTWRGPSVLYPDPQLTPGEVLSQETRAVICAKGFSTKSVRDSQTTPQEKQAVYPEYHIKKPAHNIGPTQTCEIDHFISLELGGADTLKNLWPECGVGNVVKGTPDFRIKDKVENYLHAQVCNGSLTLQEAQREISSDWYAVYLSMPH